MNIRARGEKRKADSHAIERLGSGEARSGRNLRLAKDEGKGRAAKREGKSGSPGLQGGPERNGKACGQVRKGQFDDSKTEKKKGVYIWHQSKEK